MWRIFVLVVASLLVGNGSADLSCSELGFKETLLCSTCNDLESFVPDKELVNECRKCCDEEEEGTTLDKKFKRATLTVCK